MTSIGTETVGVVKTANRRTLPFFFVLAIVLAACSGSNAEEAAEVVVLQSDPRL